MNTVRLSLVVLVAAFSVVAGCNVDFVPPAEESDSGVSPTPTDSGTPPPPVDSGVPTPPPPPTDSGTPTPPPPACGAGLTNCTGACRNLQNDNANCGTCNNHCFGGASCMAGRCVAQPPPADAGVPTPPADARILRVRGTFNEPCPGGWQFVTWGPRGSSIPGVEPFRRVEADDAPEYRSSAGGELYLPRLTRAWAGYVVLKGYCPSTAQWYGGYNLCATAADSGITLVQTVEGGDNLAAATNVCRDVYITGNQYGIMIPLTEGRNTCPSGWRGYPF